MLSYLRGRAVTLAGGTLKLDGPPTLADLRRYVRSTAYAVANPFPVENRFQQLDAALARIAAAHAGP